MESTIERFEQFLEKNKDNYIDEEEKGARRDNGKN